MAHGSSKPRSLSANEKKKFDTMQSAVLGYKEYIDARRFFLTYFVCNFRGEFDNIILISNI